MLNTTRAFLNWRRERHPLRTGTIQFVRTSTDILAFVRANDADRLLCLFNLGGKPQRYRSSEPLLDAGFASEGTKITGRSVQLPPYGFAFAHLE